MSSYRQILYHIVFRTKDSAETLPIEQCDQLYKYIWDMIKNKNSICTNIRPLWGRVDDVTFTVRFTHGYSYRVPLGH